VKRVNLFYNKLYSDFLEDIPQVRANNRWKMKIHPEDPRGSKEA
jgi:hypothetical protein